jgi:hypothetical protein
MRRVPALVPARAARAAEVSDDGGARPMIDHAVRLVAARLDAHLRPRLGIADHIVGVSDATGKTAPGAPSRLLLFVTGIFQDTMARSVPGHLTVHLMLASSFDPENYLEPLKILSHAIRFLQAHPRFDPGNAPEIDRSIERLCLEIEPLDTEAASQLRRILGGRYLPSVQYRMRVVAFAGTLAAEAPRIQAPETRTAAGAGA